MSRQHLLFPDVRIQYGHLEKEEYLVNRFLFISKSESDDPSGPDRNVTHFQTDDRSYANWKQVGLSEQKEKSNWSSQFLK